MRPGGGKRKGSSFEREISRELSLWISKGARNDLFWRTHSSGALGTISKKMSQYGDIMSIEDGGKPFTDRCNIECRHGKCLQEKDFIYPTKGSSMLQLLQEGRKNAILSNRMPIWFFKSHRKDVIVMLEYITNIDGTFAFLDLLTDYRVLAIYPQHGVMLMPFADWKKSFILEKYSSHVHQAVNSAERKGNG